jgi:hypothetical protein
MRTLLCAIPALLALAGPALAEPQQLDEAQLGGVAAGQDISATSEVTNLDMNSLSTSSVQEIGQILSGGSSNTVYATGVGSTGVTASGMAGATVSGIIGSSPSP